MDNIKLPKGTIKEGQFKTVHDAIWDLENIDVTTDVAEGNKGVAIGKAPDGISSLGLELRDSDILYNHISTETTGLALERFMGVSR